MGRYLVYILALFFLSISREGRFGVVFALEASDGNADRRWLIMTAAPRPGPFPQPRRALTRQNNATVWGSMGFISLGRLHGCETGRRASFGLICMV